MTVIAWDGKVLAADRRRTVNGTPMPATKIFKIKSPDGRLFLVGCAGDSFDCGQFVRWMRTANENDKPTTTSLSALVIDEKARAWYLSEKLLYHRVSVRCWAIGSGADYALGAMAAGRTAPQAVRIASKLDIHCGQGVDVVRF